MEMLATSSATKYKVHDVSLGLAVSTARVQQALLVLDDVIYVPKAARNQAYECDSGLLTHLLVFFPLFAV